MESVNFAYDGLGRATAQVVGAVGGATYRFYTRNAVSSHIDGDGSTTLELTDIRGMIVGDQFELAVQRIDLSPPTEFPDIGVGVCRFGTRGGAPAFAGTWAYDGMQTVTVTLA